MRRNFIGITLIVIEWLMVSLSTTADISGATAPIGMGGRAAVFDEVFVAVADDASAVYWNPAGLATLRNRYSSTLSHHSLFSGQFGLTGIQHDFLSLAHSRRRWGVGVSVDRLGTNRIIEADDIGQILSTEGSYSELRSSLGLSAKVADVASIGLTGNYFRIGSVTTSSETSVDIGALSRAFLLTSHSPSETQLRLRLGIALRNLYHSLDLSPQYTLATALQFRSYQGLLSHIGSSLTFGFAYVNRIAPDRTPKLALAVEVGPDVPNVGFVRRATLYFGVESYPSVPDSFNWKAGIRIGSGGWGFAYAREQTRFLGESHRAAIDLGLGTKAIQDVTVAKIDRDGEVPSDLRFETTDQIAVTIHLSSDMMLDEIPDFGIQLVLADATGKAIDTVDYREMELSDRYAPRYTFQPALNWLEKWGAVQPGQYTVEVFVEHQMRWRRQFELRYDSEVQRMVREARRLFETADLKTAEAQLVAAVQRDASYPDTYYTAGLVSELSGDFRGAQKCYMEAQKLNPSQMLDIQYLQPLIEGQTRQNRRGIQLYDRLKQASASSSGF